MNFPLSPHHFQKLRNKIINKKITKGKQVWRYSFYVFVAFLNVEGKVIERQMCTIRLRRLFIEFPVWQLSCIGVVAKGEGGVRVVAAVE